MKHQTDSAFPSIFGDSEFRANYQYDWFYAEHDMPKLVEELVTLTEYGVTAERITERVDRYDLGKAKAIQFYSFTAYYILKRWSSSMYGNIVIFDSRESAEIIFNKKYSLQTQRI